MFERTPEKGRGTTGHGRPIGHTRGNLPLGAGWFRVPPFSARRQNRFDETRRPGRSVVLSDNRGYGVCRHIPQSCTSSCKIALVSQISGTSSISSDISGTSFSVCSLTRGSIFVAEVTSISPPAVPRVYAVQHDRAARTPVSERGLVPRENTAFLGAARDSRNEAGGVV